MKRILFYSLMVLMMVGCKKDDPCKSISCKNGGTCVNGDCDCPPQWTGPDCSDQKTPLNVKISNVTVTGFPTYDNTGSTWDIGSAPDLYVTIDVNGSVVYDGTASRYQNATSANLTFITNVILSPNDVVVIRAYDYDDFDADDYMGGVQGFMYSSTGGFPSSRTFSCQGCPVSYTVGLEYRF